MKRQKRRSLDLIIGAGSLLDVCPAGDEHGDSYLHVYERRVRTAAGSLLKTGNLVVGLPVHAMSDEESLRSDWNAIGRDMEKAFESYGRETRSQKAAG